jgi:hypothetical protein
MIPRFSEIARILWLKIKDIFDKAVEFMDKGEVTDTVSYKFEKLENCWPN